MAILSTIRSGMQHWFNPLHVYCRLIDAGVAKEAARRLAALWERLIWPLLYVGGNA